jgi:Fic family protein
MKRKTGKYVVSTTAGEEVKAFVPEPLPPKPPLRLDKSLKAALESAERELARLDVAAKMVPDPEWFIYGFVRKEAVLTSQIEGYAPTLSDLLSWEAEAANKKTEPGIDLKETCNYLDALSYARTELAKPKGLPLSLRLIKETHKRLMQGARGEKKQPGEFRTSQNWIGGSRPGNAFFIPPPPDNLPDCLDEFEKYLHHSDDSPKLVRIALAHAQFETIHPFLDGNGRLGRLLIALLLEQWGLLGSPMLYISVYFKRNQQEYYERLNKVRTAGDWEGWTRFFLEAVTDVAAEATLKAEEIFRLFECDRRLLLAAPDSSVTGMRLLDHLYRNPYLTLSSAVKLLNVSKPTASKAISLLASLAILQEVDVRKRPRTYVYKEYLDLLKEETGA